MNTLNPNGGRTGKALAAASVAALLLAGCASAPVVPTGAADVRTKLSALQADPNLANRAPAAIKDAEAAVQLAEKPVEKSDTALGAHRVYMADRKVEIARARASTLYAEDQRAKRAEERGAARLDARTQEADRARADATAARASAADSARESEELARQIAALRAETTDRGLVLTLSDLLFATGRADLRPGTTSNLDRLVEFLNRYPDRNVQIEGHTDNVGSAEFNQGLSERRAESVKSYLVRQGIDPRRLTATGLGLYQPIADNATASGRQQNRRVMLIIDNPKMVRSNPQ